MRHVSSNHGYLRARNVWCLVFTSFAVAACAADEPDVGCRCEGECAGSGAGYLSVSHLPGTVEGRRRQDAAECIDFFATEHMCYAPSCACVCVVGPGLLGVLDAGMPDARADSGVDDAGTGTDAETPASCAIELAADDALVRIDDVNGLFPPTVTVELWARFDAPERPNQVLFAAESPAAFAGLFLLVDESPTGLEVACVIKEGAIWYGAGTDVGVAFWGAWHHIACVRDDSAAFTLYLDGLPVSRVLDTPPYVHGGTPVLLGGLGIDTDVPASLQGAFRGRLDEVRISTGGLYAASFVPRRRAVGDSRTIAEWHFDECAGATTSSSPGPDLHGGTFVGTARWVDER